jgi:hypothetical protein
MLALRDDIGVLAVQLEDVLRVITGLRNDCWIATDRVNKLLDDEPREKAPESATGRAQ